MFSVHAFATSTSGTYGTLTAINPVSDPVLATNGAFLFVPQLNNLLGVYANGTGLLRFQISTPSLLANVPYDATPVDTAAAPASPLPLDLQPLSPIKLVTDEPMGAMITSGSNAAVQGVVFLSDGPLAPVTGSIIHARGTATTSPTAGVWTNNALTLTNQLAEGNYQLVGARVEGAHVIAARFVFPGGTNATRPGVIGVGSVAKINGQELFRNGNLGVWGTFSNRVLPTIDFLSDGTSETATVILDLIKV